jgi:hypothetical protein
MSESHIIKLSVQLAKQRKEHCSYTVPDYLINARNNVTPVHPLQTPSLCEKRTRVVKILVVRHAKKHAAKGPGKEEVVIPTLLGRLGQIALLSCLC